MEAAQQSPPAQPRRARRRWLVVFLVGLALWAASVLVTGLTLNANLIPTVVLLGSFLVPVTAVFWYFEHEAAPEVSSERVFYGFVVGGVLGVLAASLLEAWLVQDGLLMYLGVGFIEELAKLLALVVVAWRLRTYSTRGGIVLGAAVGFGFAALESSGYAFNSLFVERGVSLASLVRTEVVRAVLAPVGHGLWTAIIGGALFHAAARPGRLRLTWGVAAAYILVSLLHGLWDSMRGIAIVLTVLLTATPGQLLLLERGVLPPISELQALDFLVIQFAGLVLVSAVGIGVLIFMARAWARRAALPG
jgi:RsiW-degrading membrane proteinase PrsW (M82 family)